MRNETVRSNVINTSIRVMKDGGLLPPTESVSTLHYHEELEFLPIYEGEFICTVYEKDYVARAGDVIFINSRVPHSTRRNKPARTALLQFRENDFSDSEITKIIKYSMRFQSQVFSPVKVFSSKELFAAVDDIVREASEKERSYEIFVRSSVLRILGILYREGILSDAENLYNTREVKKILPILSYINTNYADNLTLEYVSAELGFDQSYFCRIFKVATGATFTEYLNFVRICKAEKLLLKSHDSILNISEAVGFSSVSYFNRIFKKYKNCSPRVYRTMAFCNM